MTHSVHPNGAVAITDPNNTQFIGADSSMKDIIEKGLAALLYPNQGLHILLSGETGVGKSYLAEYLASIAFSKKWNNFSGHFVTFNCANYAQNPELLMGHIFGIKKGAYTGAAKDEIGLIEQANGGILFLDEIHRLPPTGQEMLFYLIDKGIYRKLGESDAVHHANLVIIGATTETLESALLPTLFRRFSLKLKVPPLRERTQKERKELLSFFLRREAQKMNIALLIKDSCKEAFLTYSCPGNIGQLKGDIQITCARAFMHHLQQGTNQVTIQEDNLPQQVLSSLKNELQTQSTEQIVAVSKQENPFPICSIYSALATIKGEKQQIGHDQASSINEMQSAINHYLSDVQSLSEKRIESEPAWMRFIEHDLLDALRDFSYYFKADFTFEFGDKQLMAIGLHLEAYRRQGRSSDLTANTVPAPQIYQLVAEKLAEFLEKRIQLQLPENEINLTAHLMASTVPEAVHKDGVSVYLVTHGDSTATSMAGVTNYLLGSPIIQPIDMPLSEATGVTYKRISTQISQHANDAGVLLLVDIGSLVTIGETISRDLGIRIRTLANVNLPMLIEAGRKALIAENDLNEVYHAARDAYLALAPKAQLPVAIEQKQRLIVTVCFTGEGTAQLLNDWLCKNIDSLDRDVAIRPIRVDPVNHDSSMLEVLQKKYQVIAIVGTVPVHFHDIPYIPAAELFMDDGHQRLKKLLEISRTVSQVAFNGQKVANLGKLAKKGLDKITTELNTDLFYTIMTKYFEPIKDYYQLDNDSTIGLWMHIGSLLEKMLQSENTGRPLVLPAQPMERTLSISKNDLKLWEPLFTQFNEKMRLNMSVPIKESLIYLAKQQN
nr:sigma 54-interacting transcriptional regulator [Sporolactobacillus spathodeae]